MGIADMYDFKIDIVGVFIIVGWKENGDQKTFKCLCTWFLQCPHVIPAKAGIQWNQIVLDSCFRRNDRIGIKCISINFYYKMRRGLVHMYKIILITISLFYVFFPHVVLSSLKKTVEIAFIDDERIPNIHSMPYRERLVWAALKMAEEDWASSKIKKKYNVKVKRYFYGKNPIDVIPVIKTVLAEDTIAGIGLATSEYATLAAPILHKTSYTVITPYASARSLWNYTPNLLFMADSTCMESKAISKFLKNEIRPKRPMAIVASDSTYSKELFGNLDSEIKNRFLVRKVLNDSKDLEEIAENVKSYKPDLVFLPLFGVFSGHIVREIAKQGYQVTFVGGQSWGETHGKAFNLVTQGVDFKAYTVRFPSRYFPVNKQIEFSKRLKNEFDVEFSPLAANIYDSLIYLFHLVNNLDEPTRINLKKSLLNNQKFEGIFGTVCLDKESCVARTYSVIEVDGRGFRPYKQIGVRDIDCE